jgi:hypothetical protein
MFLSHSEDCYREQGVHFRVQRRGRRGALIPLVSVMREQDRSERTLICQDLLIWGLGLVLFRIPFGGVGLD